MDETLEGQKKKMKEECLIHKLSFDASTGNVMACEVRLNLSGKGGLLRTRDRHDVICVVRISNKKASTALWSKIQWYE
jgi:hypothetical protein